MRLLQKAFQIMPKIYTYYAGIMPYMLSSPYYAINYAGIADTTLVWHSRPLMDQTVCFKRVGYASAHP